jgi:CelD/BcsL family acetyltransferase involved in cellulose biosynthesis
MRIERITDTERFRALGNEWNELEGGEGLSSPAFAHEWFSAWLEAFGGEVELATIALFDETELVGVAPLCLTHGRYRGIGCRQLRFLYNRHGPRCTFLMRRRHGDAARLLLEEALRLVGWDLAVFENVPHESYLYESFVNWSESKRLPALARKTMSSPFLKTKGSWEEFLESRSRNLKRSLRKKESKLFGAGKMTIERFTDAASAAAVMETLFKLGERSWKARGGRAIGSGRASRAFYSCLAESFGKENEVSIWLMRLDGEPVAFEFHLTRGRQVQALRAEFDESYREMGAGSVLDKEIVKSLFELGFDEYDMGGEADFYKLRWSDTSRQHSELLAFNDSVTGKLLCTMEKLIVEPLKSVARPFLRRGEKRP